MKDTELHAWLDSELTQEERAEVESWLREHPGDAAQVRMWASDADTIRERFDPVLKESVPVRLEQIVWNRGPEAMSTRWQRVAVAAAIFVGGGLIGAVVGWRVAPATDVASAEVPASAWVQRAALAHKVYAPEVRHPVEVNVSDKSAVDHVAQEAHLQRWLTNRIDVPVKLFDLRAQGFELVGGRLLPDSAGPSAQLMYQNASRQRVTIYLRKPESVTSQPTPATFEYERVGELGMFYWVEGQAGYALVGDLRREQLLALAESIYKQGGGTAEHPGS